MTHHWSVVACAFALAACATKDAVTESGDDAPRADASPSADERIETSTPVTPVIDAGIVTADDVAATPPPAADAGVQPVTDAGTFAPVADVVPATDGAPRRRVVCPAGPFPAPAVLSSKSVCADFPFAYNWSEGPTWVAEHNAFFFTHFTIRSATGGDIMKYTPGGSCEIFIKDAGCNGLAVGRDGNLLAACHESRSVVSFDLVTKQRTTVADTYMGMMLDTPNDLVVHSNGTVYFTNPTFELAGRPPGVGAAVFRLDPAGSLSLIARSSCNGIALSPTEQKLYVVGAGVWDLDASGMPTTRTPEVGGMRGDGMGVDCAGNVYVGGGIFSPAGQRLADYGAGTNLAFGGPDGTTVLVAGPNREMRELRVSVPGLP